MRDRSLFKYVGARGHVDDPLCEDRLDALLEGCKRGDRMSQVRLYTLFYRFALGVCLRYVRERDDAVEVVNEGFYKVMTNLDRYTPGLSFKGWMKRIMVNVSIDSLRRREKYLRNVDVLAAPEVPLGPEVWSMLSEAVILEAVQQLPDSYRAVFVLHAIEGYRHEEIAQMLGISIGTSKSNLSIARAKLRIVLRGEFGRAVVRGL